MVLISSALLLLAAGAIAIGQLYWSGLHSGMARMRVSIDDASRRQVMLADQVRAAEQALRERQAELDRREAALDARADEPRGVDLSRSPQYLTGQPRLPASAPGQLVPGVVAGTPPATIDAIDPRRLRAMLTGIVRDVARLPPPVRRVPPVGLQMGPRAMPPSGHRAVKAQVEVVETALALGDPVLFDLTAAAAQQLLLKLYAGSEPRAQDLARQLGELRAALRPTARPMR